MLIKTGILTADVGSTLLAALIEMESEGPESFSFDPALEDIYLNLEHMLIQKVGPDVGGRFHTGRSRNDIYATMSRMATRESMTSVLESLFELRRVILERAAQHAGTVMPGYTHLKPAQPTTFGHYLVSVALALERDSQRLIESYPRLNLNPLGACAFAGTGFPLDRQMTAELLGFDGLVESTLDAVASRDYVSEILVSLAVAGVTVSRLALDIYMYCSDEWGTMEVADEVATSSSIMPQKKNPMTLEEIKGKAGHLIGALVSTLAVQKNVNFMHCRDMSMEAVTPVWEAFYQAEAMFRLMGRTLFGLEVREELMRTRAAEDFSTATELADCLVREEGLPFRLAHSIVANVVTMTLERGLRFHEITPSLIEAAAESVAHRRVRLTADQVTNAIDPGRNLEAKKASGSPSVVETGRLIDLAMHNLEGHQALVRRWEDRQRQTREELESSVAVLTGRS